MILRINPFYNVSDETTISRPKSRMTKSRVLAKQGVMLSFDENGPRKFDRKKRAKPLFYSRIFKERSHQNETSRHAKSKSSGFYFWPGYFHI